MWHFNEGSWTGTVGQVLDETANNNDGTSSRGASTNADTIFLESDDTLSRSGVFNGSTDLVIVPDSASLNDDFDSTTGPITLEAWIKMDEKQANNATIVSKVCLDACDGSNVDRVSYALQIADNQRLRIRVADTNGENTAFIPIKEYLGGSGFPGYIGYQSDSEVFAHILHYVTKQLKLPLEAYKHILTPLKTEEFANHPQGDFLRGLRDSCRRLIIDGPNAVMGTLPDETTLLVMDAKKLRPATIGGNPGEWALASEMCGVDAMIPERDKTLDYQPMRENTVIIPPDRKEYKIWSQFDPFPLHQAA